MLMRMDRTSRNGFMMAEVMVGTALLALALAALAVIIQGVSRMNLYQWTRQQCVAAAQAQLDSLAAVGKPIDESEIQRLWPQVRTEIDRTSGEGSWRGLELVRVTAVGWAGSHEVPVRLERYFPKDDR
jgi:type II secretory pathway pseudopilin PulG